MQNFVPTRFRIRKVMILLLLAFLSVYVVYNIFSGDRGLINLRKLKAKHDNLSTEISALQQQKDSSTKQVKQMQNKSLDLDLLDERSRKHLGVAGEGEAVYMDK